MSTNNWLECFIKTYWKWGGRRSDIKAITPVQLELPNLPYLPLNRHQQGWPGRWLGKFRRQISRGKFGTGKSLAVACSQPPVPISSEFAGNEHKLSPSLTLCSKIIKFQISLCILQTIWNVGVKLLSCVCFQPARQWKAPSYQTNLILTCFEEWLLKVELILVWHKVPEVLGVLV